MHACLCVIAGVEMHLPALSSARYSSIQAQVDEGRALESLIQTILLRWGVAP
jgi:hypothetical protein